MERVKNAFWTLQEEQLRDGLSNLGLLLFISDVIYFHIYFTNTIQKLCVYSEIFLGLFRYMQECTVELLVDESWL